MAGLIITHLPGVLTPRFEVVRQRDHRRAPAVEVISPYSFPVKDRPDDNFMSQLAWYLEHFLEYPFPPRTNQATNVEEALESWGREAFSVLFDSGVARDWMTEAKRATEFRLQVSADDPGILSWPWEALYDPEMGVLAHRAQVERRLNKNLPDPPPLSAELPKDRINILLVTARPYEQDIHFRSISRPLVELIQKGQLPVHVDLLRPPTFDQLRKHLAAHSHFYHILHFDGHGRFQDGATPGAELFGSMEGQLVFEKEDGKPDPITAADLSDLLREQAVPVVVLNACNSAMHGAQARDPFASVAAALLKSGTRGVVAMAYSLYVRAAQEFLPAFYRGLFQTGSLVEGARWGRRELRAHPQRSLMATGVKLRDWLVPVVYQQGEELSLRFWGQVTGADQAQGIALPEEAKLETRYTFTGRDGAFLELERALRRKPCGILIHGLTGMGKTTLVRAFVQWLRDTGGLGQGCFWFRFDDIHTSAHVFNEMGRTLFGPEFGLGNLDASIALLAKAFSERHFVLVWDNFESVCGVPEAGIEPLLSPEDRTALQRFLSKLRGARTKVLITSRAEEAWLGPQDCYKVPLVGLRGEEVWDYAAQILDDLGLTVDRRDAALADLLKWIGGHPLAMQMVLLQAQKRTIPELRSALELNFGSFSGLADDIQRRLYASLDILRQSLTEDLRLLLVPLSLHEKYLEADRLELMAKRVDSSIVRTRIDRFISVLTPTGLLMEHGSAVYEIHPLLPSFLRSEVLSKSPAEEVQKWNRAFVEVMAQMADALAGLELFQQRMPFAIHHANFHRALLHAEKLEMHQAWAALMQAMAAYALNRRSFVTAQRLYVRFADQRLEQDDEGSTASAYHQLGSIALEQRDFAAAEGWYLKSLQIKEKLGLEQGTAVTYHQLGRIAEQQRDFTIAKGWYLKSLQVSEKRGLEQRAATSYHQLGSIAQEQRDFSAAEEWYLKSLQVSEKSGLEQYAASTYHQLGIIAQLQGNFATANCWYLKSLQIQEKLGSEHGVAGIYHQLGMIAQGQGVLAEAERWYLKSLQISEKLGLEHGAALTYHELGRIAEQQRDFPAAESWYLKSLQINVKLGDEYGAARTYGQLGVSALLQQRFTEAGQWFLKALAGFRTDQAMAQMTIQGFIRCLCQAPSNEQRKLRALWVAAGLSPLPEDFSTA